MAKEFSFVGNIKEREAFDIIQKELDPQASQGAPQQSQTIQKAKQRNQAFDP